MRFDELLATARKAKGLNQEQLAEMVGVSRQAVSKWETGDAQPDFTKLLALADALEMSIDALCGREFTETKEECKAKKPRLKWLFAVAIVLFSVLFFWVGFFVGKSLPKGTVINEEMAVRGISFSAMASDGTVNFRFVPSAFGEEYTYTLLLCDELGNTQNFDVACKNGKCAGVITLERGKTYSVSVEISNGTSTQAILLASSLRIYGKEVLWNRKSS